MIERLPSGQRRLDAILGGGLVRHSINVIAGLPGSGKTLLAQQYVFTNATPEAPALYCTTASEPLDKLVRYGQTLAFFDPAVVGSSVLYEELGTPLLSGGLPAVQQRLAELLRDRRPGLLVIDSFRALHPFATDEVQFRTFVAELAGRLTAHRVTSLWVGEYEAGEIGSAPEFAVADAIVALDRARDGDRVRRDLEVMKLRGSDFLSGRHAYRLSSRGLEPFPRLADVPVSQAYQTPGGRLTSGVDELDRMLGGGFASGTSTLIAGPSGVGKTTVGLQSLVAGAANGEPAIVANLQENPSQLRRFMASVGWDGADIDIFYRSPVDLYLDEWVYELLDRIEATGARRVLIDSLTDLQMASRDRVRFEEYLYSLVQRLARQNLLLIMTLETSAEPGNSLWREPISHLADNVLILRYVPLDGELRRGLMVLKTRASANDRQLRELRIGDGGVEITDPVVVPDPLRANPAQGFSVE
jgi:circadian clock protein KaiC